jgi:transitional endoplasmic reticulum ATPase
MEVLTLCYFLGTGGIIETYLTNSFSIGNLKEFGHLRKYGHIPMGLKRSELLSVFNDDALFRNDILHLTFGNKIDISDWCDQYLSGLGNANLGHHFFSRGEETHLELSDFEIPEEEYLVLDTLLRSETGQNILFYGETGTGKTALAKCLAKNYGRVLLVVRASKTDDHAERIGYVYGTINFADQNSIVLVDEADSILNTSSSFLFKSRNDKSWINTVLEYHKKKVIWITNQIDQINPSTMRRFSFSMEFRKFDEEKRLKVLNGVLEKEDLAGYFSPEEIRDLCQSYSVYNGPRKSDSMLSYS